LRRSPFPRPALVFTSSYEWLRLVLPRIFLKLLLFMLSAYGSAALTLVLSVPFFAFYFCTIALPEKLFVHLIPFRPNFSFAQILCWVSNYPSLMDPRTSKTSSDPPVLAVPVAMIPRPLCWRVFHAASRPLFLRFSSVHLSSLPCIPSIEPFAGRISPLCAPPGHPAFFNGIFLANFPGFPSPLFRNFFD